MSEREKRRDDPAHDGDDAAAEFVRDFAEEPPVKSIETVKAASDTVKKADKSKREERIRARAYRLWENNGRPEGRHDEFWKTADAEIGDEEADADK